MLVLLLLAIAPMTSARIGEGGARKLDTRKCCLMTQVLVEKGPSQRACTDKLGQAGLDPMSWQGKQLGQFAIHHGKPQCSGDEKLIPLYHHDNQEAFSHQLELESTGFLVYNKPGGESIRFGDEKYCVDKLWVGHNYSHVPEETLSNFAYVCLDVTQSVEELVNNFVYPIGVAVSMACLTLTFLLYLLLPQLRDLTGKFILGICSFLVCNYALLLINAEMLGFNDPNLEDLALEMLGHTCVLGAWLCLNCMGHHVWKVIQSKSVFTRVTDGQRCCYYSMYVTITAAAISCLAIAAHFLIGEEEGLGENHVGLVALAVFYVPVLLLVLVNIYFYATSTRQIGKQLVYNRNMQHFQVNFDLFTKLFLVVGVCWLFQTLALLDISALEYIGKIFTLLQGPLIFVVAMCRTRVAFLFKRYFCQDSCCVPCCRGGGDFIELPAEELSTIDRAKEALEKDDEEGAGRRLLDRWGDANPRDREMSKSLFNVRSRPDGDDREAPQTPLMKVVGMIKASSLANLNFGWRKETSV